jgi:diguanylate cyclase (GGDEF)-like protein
VSKVDPVRVLIVDDDPSALRLLERHLTNAGNKVIKADNGVEAMRILQAESAQIVITDWVMPEMDGLQLCRAIRKHEGIPFVFVIVVTAFHTGDDCLVEAFDAGANDYLCKPYKASELLARVRAGERMVRLQQELDKRNREAHRYNAEIEIANGRLAAANRELNRMATTDELTGLSNRREAMLRLSEAWAASKRRGLTLACVAIDIDRFKSCNDAYGHSVGDEALKETARVLQASARGDEPVYRVGGEEFLVICPGSCEALAAIGAERLRRAVEANLIQCGDLALRVTVSLGVAERTKDMRGPDDLLRIADNALFAAKDAGRNTVCLAGADEKEPSDDGDPRQGLSTGLLCRGMDENRDEPARVLIVDDDPSMLMFCRKFLEREGYEIAEAVDGADALQSIEQDPPDVIIMNAVMPNVDGLECTRRLKSRPKTATIPIIVCSARSDATDIVAGLEAGADEHLRKPLNPKELVLRVRTMVRLKRELGRSNEVRGEQSRALGLLLDFSRDIAAADSLDEILEHTLVTAASLTCCRRVAVMLPDADEQTLTVAKCLGMEPYRVADVRVPFGAPVSGQVFESREAVVIASAVDAKRHGRDPDAVILSSFPSVSAPLCAPDGVVGILNVTGRQGGRPFTPVDIEYLDLICNIAASAIHDRQTRRARDEARHSIVVALAKLAEYRDNETGKHVERVTRFCVVLAWELRSIERHRAPITDEFIADLKRAAPLHDIGKVAIPDHILLKPGPLGAEETAVMQTHASIGAHTIHSVLEREPGASFLIVAEEIARAHHEWYGGGGYPCGLRGEEIPLAARITAVADAYDAITTRRVYKPAMTHEEARAIITDASGKQFDPDVVDALCRCEAEFVRLAAELADDPATDAGPTSQSVSDRLDQQAGLPGLSHSSQVGSR